jgi:hypothetical protein
MEVALTNNVDETLAPLNHGIEIFSDLKQMEVW